MRQTIIHAEKPEKTSFWTRSKTVETYRENIKVKLNLANATELIQHTVTWVLDSGGAIDVVNRKL